MNLGGGHEDQDDDGDYDQQRHLCDHQQRGERGLLEPKQVVRLLLRGLKEQVVAKLRLVRPGIVLRIGLLTLPVGAGQLEEEGGVGREEEELGEHGGVRQRGARPELVLDHLDALVAHVRSLLRRGVHQLADHPLAQRQPVAEEGDTGRAPVHDSQPNAAEAEAKRTCVQGQELPLYGQRGERNAVRSRHQGALHLSTERAFGFPEVRRGPWGSWRCGGGAEWQARCFQPGKPNKTERRGEGGSERSTCERRRRTR